MHACGICTGCGGCVPGCGSCRVHSRASGLRYLDMDLRYLDPDFFYMRSRSSIPEVCYEALYYTASKVPKQTTLCKKDKYTLGHGHFHGAQTEFAGALHRDRESGSFRKAFCTCGPRCTSSSPHYTSTLNMVPVPQAFTLRTGPNLALASAVVQERS